MNSKQLVKYSITILLLLYLFIFRIDIKQFLSVLENAEWGLYILCYPLGFLGMAINTWKWKLALNAKKIHISFGFLFRYFAIGTFYNFFLPGTVGGDVVKIHKVNKSVEVDVYELAGSVVIGRIFGLLTSYFFAVFGFIYNYNTMSEHIRVSCLAVLVVLTIMLVFFFNRPLMLGISSLFKSRFGSITKLMDKVEKFYQAIYTIMQLRKQPKFLIGLIALSLIFYLLSSIGIVYLFIQFLGYDVSYIYLASVLPIINIVTLLPISFGGIGFREVLFVYFFASVGMPAEAAVSVGLLVLGYRLINSLIGSYFVFAEKDY